MRNRRLAAWGVFLAIGGAVGGTIGYGAYYRSDGYRRSVEADLQAFFGLPTLVGRIEPYSFSARRLVNVELWLPEKRARIFRSPHVLWDAGGAEGTVLDIHEAALTIGSKEWAKEDYMRVLRASLQHNFQDLDIRQVRLHQARLDWPRNGFRLTADGVDGKLVFDEQGRGWAELTSHSLNGAGVTEPIRIAARLDPQSEQFLPEVTLVVPTLPLPALGLEPLLQSAVTQGAFAGRITLRQSPGGDDIELTGLVKEVRLAEWTAWMPGGPLPARVNLTLEDALIRDRRLVGVGFRGAVTELEVNALLRRFGWPEMGGTARVIVYDGQVAGGELRRLSVAGEWIGEAIEKLGIRPFDRSGIRGPFRLRVNALVVENNEVASGDVELIVEPPPGQTATLSRSVLSDLWREYLTLPFPDMLLPEQIEYVQLGARLVIDRQQVRVLGAGGPAGPAIITARILDRDVPLLGQLDLTFPLQPILAKAKKKLHEMKQEWRSRLIPARDTLPARP